MGCGPLGALAASEDAKQRRLRELAEKQRRQAHAYERRIDAQIDEHYKALRTHVHAVLVACGWYAHERQWRRYTLTGDTMTEALAPIDQTPEAIEALLERCNVANPKRADLNALRKLVASSQGASLAALSGYQVAIRLIEEYDSHTSTLMVIRGEMERLAHDLGYDTAPTVERALIEHIVACWVRMQLAEMTLTTATQKEHTHREGIYREKRLSDAQRRYLRAMHTLARLRSLAPANVQINVAHNQQVNNSAGI